MSNIKYKYTDQEFSEAVSKAFSYNDIFVILGMKISGSQYPAFKNRIKRLELDTTHFKGRGWNKGKKFPGSRSKSLEQILVKDSNVSSTHALKIKIINSGLLSDCCGICGISEWNGKKLGLQLHHMNGVRDDNRIENLQVLCPNCHSQTDTFCKKKDAPVAELE